MATIYLSDGKRLEAIYHVQHENLISVRKREIYEKTYGHVNNANQKER